MHRYCRALPRFPSANNETRPHVLLASKPAYLYRAHINPKIPPPPPSSNHPSIPPSLHQRGTAILLQCGVDAHCHRLMISHHLRPMGKPVQNSIATRVNPRENSIQIRNRTKKPLVLLIDASESRSLFLTESLNSVYA